MLHYVLSYDDETVNLLTKDVIVQFKRNYVAVVQRFIPRRYLNASVLHQIHVTPMAIDSCDYVYRIHPDSLHVYMRAPLQCCAVEQNGERSVGIKTI